MWGRGRFHSAAVGQRAVATPTVLTPSRPDSGPSGGTRKTTTLDLGKSMVVRGDLSASEDLTIEGRVEGTITVGGHILTVGHHGQIEAQIVARVATIRGTVHGDVTATEKVEILATGLSTVTSWPLESPSLKAPAFGGRWTSSRGTPSRFR